MVRMDDHGRIAPMTSEVTVDVREVLPRWQLAWIVFRAWLDLVVILRVNPLHPVALRGLLGGMTFALEPARPRACEVDE